PREGFVEMLRVIGQDLDREEKYFDRIVQDPGGFLLTMPGTTYVQPAQRKYLNSELLSSSRRRREWRRPDPNAIDLSESILYDIPEPPPPPPRPEPPRPAAPTDGPDDDGPLSRRLRR